MFIHAFNIILLLVIVFFPWNTIPPTLFNIMKLFWFKILLLIIIVTLCEEVDTLCGMFVAIIYILLSREQINYNLPKIHRSSL